METSKMRGKIVFRSFYKVQIKFFFEGTTNFYYFEGIRTMFHFVKTPNLSYDFIQYLRLKIGPIMLSIMVYKVIKTLPQELPFHLNFITNHNALICLHK